MHPNWAKFAKKFCQESSPFQPLSVTTVHATDVTIAKWPFSAQFRSNCSQNTRGTSMASANVVKFGKNLAKFFRKFKF